ncbi:hypothetical protein PPL_02767 [Heterostelium album PN500]|uniref:COI1 F-box domain-containing protein n=1 Tax=Heterostelium pallidum (strain ATCC 26659 / Pp 5 / PN500) TaxID=670386 RepID=D3B302_HETP5|nr:hypothetical protein PPL_02767 [Heterostelium album PN500]EFA83700.1 hypothetical protein PPL_02767 [Heterostelium album PN500]|eukprot:XP_020435817.1 hypothetical protein PPL_02767 [Heterostelium album PN500]
MIIVSNISHLLLAKIISYLDDNIDRICFTLVCRRWFNDRHRYLLFNDIKHVGVPNMSKICMNSYKSLINDSMQQKRSKMIMGPNNRYKYYSSGIQTATINISGSNSNTTSYVLAENLYQIESNSNITNIKRCLTLKDKFPPSLTSLSLDQAFEEPLFRDCFPQSLRKLRLNKDTQPLGHGVLPSSLEKLIIVKLMHPIEPGVLPASLRSLYIIYSKIEGFLKVGSLPNQLESYFHSMNVIHIEDNVLPTSLKSLMNIPTIWIPHLSSLVNLRSLSFLLLRNTVVLDLSVLPSSLTALNLIGSPTLKSALPISIRHLQLCNSFYNLDELFPDRSNYHLEVLGIDGFSEQSLVGLDIKRLELGTPFTDSRKKLREIPFGVRELSLCTSNAIVDDNTFPSTLRELNVYDLTIFNQSGVKLPNSIKHLILRSNDSNITKISNNIFPNSLESIKISTISIPFNSMVDNLTIKNDNCNCTIRKLDNDYFILFGMIDRKFIASLFHKSKFHPPNKFKSILKNKISNL